MVQLPVWDGQRRARDQDALRARREHAHAVDDALLQLVGQLVRHLGAAGRVVEEGDLHHEQGILTADGYAALGLARLEHARERAALVVDQPDGRAQGLGRERAPGDAFHLVREVGDLARPLLDVLGALHLRHVHDVGALVGAEYLVGLLLAVARGLPHVHIRHAEVGAGLAEVRAERRLHQRAHVAGQHLLALGHPELRAAAQAGHGAAAGHHHLVGHEHAERAEHLFLQLDELGGAHAVYLGYHEVVEGHVLGTVLLGEVRVAEGGGQHGAQLVVRLQVHVQIGPHLAVVGHRGNPPRRGLRLVFSSGWGRARAGGNAAGNGGAEQAGAVAEARPPASLEARWVDGDAAPMQKGDAPLAEGARPEGGLPSETSIAQGPAPRGTIMIRSVRCRPSGPSAARGLGGGPRLEGARARRDAAARRGLCARRRRVRRLGNH